MVYNYKEELSVQEEKCIITGGARGLSKSMAGGLLENGAEVALMNLQKERLEQAVEEYCKKGYKAHGIADDLSRKAELSRMSGETMELLGGKLDVMIPTTGIQRRYEPWEFPEEMWDLVINVDLNRVWFIYQQAVQVIWDKGTVSKITNIGSMNSFFGGTTVPTYSAAKGVVTRLSKSIASDYADYSIRYNVIAPGYMNTKMCANISQERKDECTKRVAADRWGRPEDLRGLILFSASSASDYLNGAVIPVSGGFLVRPQKVNQTNLKVLKT